MTRATGAAGATGATGATKATEADIAQSLALSGACRDLRHAWISVTDAVIIEVRGQVRHFTRTLRCTRCDTCRIDEYAISRRVLGRVRTRYVYPKGYHIDGGLPVDEVRFRMFNKMVMEVETE